MRVVGVLAAFSFVFALTSAACSGNGGETPPPSVVPTGDGGTEECVDEDGDGFGSNCEFGRDCDDADPDVTDECRRCSAVSADCPCTPGTRPMSCVPPVMHRDGGTLVCKEGNRYCRDGRWSACEAIADYIFVPDN